MTAPQAAIAPMAHERTAIVLFAHGSRDPQWRLPLEAIAAQIRDLAPGTAVSCAYLELCPPSLPEAAAALIAGGASGIRIFPIFFGVGKHAREDLPKLVRQLREARPDIPLELLPAAGEYEALISLLAKIALMQQSGA